MPRTATDAAGLAPDARIQHFELATDAHRS